MFCCIFHFRELWHSYPLKRKQTITNNVQTHYFLHVYNYAGQFLLKLHPSSTRKKSWLTSTRKGKICSKTSNDNSFFPKMVLTYISFIAALNRWVLLNFLGFLHRTWKSIAGAHPSPLQLHILVSVSPICCWLRGRPGVKIALKTDTIQSTWLTALKVMKKRICFFLGLLWYFNMLIWIVWMWRPGTRYAG